MDHAYRLEAEDAGTLIEKVIVNAMRGHITSPRGFLSRESQGVSMRLTNSLNNIVVSEKMKVNYRFMVAEWLWMLFGLNAVEPIARYLPKMWEFSDDKKTMAGAYGPHIMNQSEYILSKLREDHDSRQAVLTIWQPNPRASRDIPCTVAAQFIRSGAYLNGIFTMRSSDTWIGLKYDLFCFSQFVNYFAACLDWEPGFLQINAGSSHIYESNWSEVTDYVGSGYEYATSPSMAGSLPVPPLLKRALLSEDCSSEELIGYPWLRYGKVLCAKTNSEALVYLR